MVFNNARITLHDDFLQTLSCGLEMNVIAFDAVKLSNKCSKTVKQVILSAQFLLPMKTNCDVIKRKNSSQYPIRLDLIGRPERHRGPRTANRHLPKPREALRHDRRHLCLQVLDSHIFEGQSENNFEDAPTLPAHHDRERVSYYYQQRIRFSVEIIVPVSWIFLDELKGS